MNIYMKQIATIKSPFCDLKNMPVQLKGAKDTYATLEFKKNYFQGGISRISYKELL